MAWKKPGACVASLAVGAPLKPRQVKRTPGHQIHGSRTLGVLPAGGASGTHAPRDAAAAHLRSRAAAAPRDAAQGGGATSSRRAAAGTEPHKRGDGSRACG